MARANRVSKDRIHRVRIKFGKGLHWESLGIPKDEECDFSVPDHFAADDLAEYLSSLCDGTLRPEHLRIRLEGSVEPLASYTGAQASTSSYRPKRLTLASQGVQNGVVLEVDVVLHEEEMAGFGLDAEGAIAGASTQGGVEVADGTGRPAAAQAADASGGGVGNARDEENDALLGLQATGKRKGPAEADALPAKRPASEPAATAWLGRRPAAQDGMAAAAAPAPAAVEAEGERRDQQRQQVQHEQPPKPRPGDTGAYGMPRENGGGGGGGGSGGGGAAAAARASSGRCPPPPLSIAGHWTPKEVEELADAIEKYGLQWSVIEKETKLRDQKSLRYKWRNLVSSIQAKWSTTRGLQLPGALRDRLSLLYEQYGRKRS